jgi:DNA-binding response OmpR family regulator
MPMKTSPRTAKVPKVLLVGPRPGELDGYERALETAGLVVLHVDSAVRALRVLAGIEIDAVVLAEGVLDAPTAGGLSEEVLRRAVRGPIILLEEWLRRDRAMVGDPMLARMLAPVRFARELEQRCRTDSERLDARHERPRMHASSAASAVSAARAPGRGDTAANRLAILIVDDDIDVVETYATYFEMRGAIALRARSAAEALVLARTIAVDAIVTDIAMAQESGLVLAKRLRAEPPLVRTPIIAVSGVLLERHRAAILGAGVDAFFTKPVKPAVLEEGIRFLVASRVRA